MSDPTATRPETPVPSPAKPPQAPPAAGQPGEQDRPHPVDQAAQEDAAQERGKSGGYD